MTYLRFSLDKRAFHSSINLLSKCVTELEFDLVAGIDARGFIFASSLAFKLEKGLVMLRKKNKLPGKKLSLDYDLEYGKDTIEINVNVKLKRFCLLMIYLQQVELPKLQSNC